MKRFFKKEYQYDWWFIFDKEQEYIEEMEIPFETDYGDLVAMSEEQVIDLLNKYYEENKKMKNILKMQEVQIEHLRELVHLADEIIHTDIDMYYQWNKVLKMEE